jgi:hypothetical protein
VKDSHQPPRSAKKKRAAKKTGKTPFVTSKIVTTIGRQINDRWPNLGRQLGSLFRLGREKIDDLYSSAAQTMSEQKESFDDRRAARKAQERIAIRTVPPAPSARSVPKARTGKGCVTSPSPKRNS